MGSGGVRSSISTKMVCLNLVRWMSGQLRSKTHISLSKAFAGKQRRRKIANKVLRVSVHLASLASGVAEGTLRAWRREYGHGILRGGAVARGPQRRTTDSFFREWAPLYEWADRVCENARVAGEGLTWADITHKALACEEVKRFAMDLVLATTEKEVAARTADPDLTVAANLSNPTRVLQRLNLEDSVVVKGSDQMTVDRWQWRLQRLLGRMCFSWERLVHDSLQNMINCPFHTEKCTIRCSDNRILWPGPGYEFDVSRESLQWYESRCTGGSRASGAQCLISCEWFIYLSPLTPMVCSWSAPGTRTEFIPMPGPGRFGGLCGLNRNK